MPRLKSLIKGHKSTIFHWIHWGNWILTNTINYEVKVLWQVLTTNKRGWKNLADFLGEYFWTKYFCEATWVQKGHKPLFGPSRTPSGDWRYDGALCQTEMASCAVVGRFTEVLHRFPLLAWSHQPLLAMASSIWIKCSDCWHQPFKRRCGTVGKSHHREGSWWGTVAN